GEFPGAECHGRGPFLGDGWGPASSHRLRGSDVRAGASGIGTEERRRFPRTLRRNVGSAGAAAGPALGAGAASRGPLLRAVRRPAVAGKGAASPMIWLAIVLLSMGAGWLLG